MTQPFRITSAASFAVFASMLAGCAAHQSHVAARSNIGKADPEAGLATRALTALNANNLPVAIDLAERAVAKTPADAGIRALLGNSYFAAGRFMSAEGAFKDSLTLDPSEPQVILKLALVQIAQGKNSDAFATLNVGRAVLDPSDYGLATALAGRPNEAVAVLQAAARRPGADATVRQNLALALALAGDWTDARTVAAQDVPEGQLDERIHQWMQLAKPTHPSDQVAALVGIRPAAVDAGQPVQLAINKVDAPQLQLAATAAVQQKLPVSGTVQHAAAPARPSLAAAMPAPAAIPAPVHAVAPAPPVALTTITTLAASAVAEARAVIASFTHSAPIAPRPAVVRRASLPVQTASLRLGSSQTVVQLGAYASPERVLTAWNGEARKYSALKSYLPMSARFSSPKGNFYRLSVRGFNSVAEANSLCSRLKHEGGSCFVRNFAGDAPVQYASR